MRPGILICLLLCACTDSRDLLEGDAPVDSVLTPDADADPEMDPDADPDPEPDTPASVCGNGLMEPGEACEGDEQHCMLVDGAYVAGAAPCLDDCTGYDEARCLTYADMEALIRTAAEITGQAQVQLMGLDLVGMYEWEVKQVIDASFEAGGADDVPAFAHIVAAGPSALELHYSGGGRLIEDGHLLLVDIGARYGGYCGDITRTIPAGGTFTDRQRELYQLVLDAQTAVAESIRPGVDSLDDMYYFTLDFFRASELRALDASGVERTMDVFFVHHISHYIGFMVHAEDLLLDPGEPAQVGQVFSIEPGLYIESEGIGIRIEDDYVLTADGAVDLAPLTPRTVEDIEEAMAAP